MSNDQKKKKRNPIFFEPGELDKTRQRLGNIDPEEAKKMVTVLGGEIGIEKPMPIDRQKVRSVASKYRTPKPTRRKHTPTTTNRQSAAKTQPETDTPQEKQKKGSSIPKWDSKNRIRLTKLMFSDEHRIKQAPSILGKLIVLTPLGANDKIMPEYITHTLKKHIAHIDRFIYAIKKLTETPAILGRIAEKTTWHDEVLYLISEWDTYTIKQDYLVLKTKAANAEIKDTIPIVKNLYKTFIRLYFISESEMTHLIKKAYTEISAQKPKQKEGLLKIAKIAAAEWLYIYEHVLKGMYPLLNRMTSNSFQPYPEYFTKNISDILGYLDITKYDLLFPSNRIKNQGSQSLEENKKEQAEKERAKAEKQIAVTNVTKSIAVLERLFPGAGWNDLNRMPDMYPYFHPLFQFKEGANLIPPSNPLQITLVLLRIIELLFQSCRYINFTVAGDDDFVTEKDSLQDIFSTWSLYREAIIERQLIPELKEIVDQLHTQPDYISSIYGKRRVSGWLWQEKYYFLPHLSFELIFVEKTNKTESYVPLSGRVAYLKKVFSLIVQRADEATLTYTDPYQSGKNLGADNLWKNFEFEIPNILSTRLEILLGGKKSKHLTNLNLIKYTLCVINVLDWWINSEESPAYKAPISTIYRIDESGYPIFSVPLLSNQNKLFIQSIKDFGKQEQKN
ncbi:MAG TPA: hypothetical protein VFC68_01460 [Treponemataceae bacterium]|nr:hypothetical protein [Treponemataceae bacterium]